MTVSFFTNSVGNYARNSTVVNTEVGSWWDKRGNVTPVNTSSSSNVETAFSGKNPVTHGDPKRIKAYDYHRRGGQVQKNTPSVIKHSRRYDNGAGEETTITSYLSAGLQNPSTLGDPPEWTGILNNNASAALDRAYSKLKAGNVQNGADIAEAKKTANMIAETGTTLLRAYLAAKRGSWNQVPRILGMDRRTILHDKFLANKWLEYQYGWKPLYGSIYDNTLLLIDVIHRETAAFKVVGKSKTRWYTESISSTANSWDCNSYCEVGFTARPNANLLSSMDKTGLLNPLSIAWELTPLSFVVDWFVPVGNMLENLTATMGLDFIAGYRSFINDRTYSRRGIQASLPSYQTLTSPGEYSVELFDFWRFAFGSFPWPELYVKESPFSSSHIATALALLRQAKR